AREGRSLYLLGGEADAAARAADVLRRRWPALAIAGVGSPRVGSPPAPEELARIRAAVLGAAPNLLLIKLGSPKQEQLIQALHAALPRTWMVGVGISFSFVAGTIRRAPRALQRTGLEWLWRLRQEPRRLARRYLIDDL